jgi:hypothetical protein
MLDAPRSSGTAALMTSLGRIDLLDQAPNLNQYLSCSRQINWFLVENIVSLFRKSTRCPCGLCA